MVLPASRLRILFLVNPISGVNQERKSVLIDRIPQVINRDRFEWEIHESISAEDLYETSKKAVADGVNIVVAVGGDGTVNRVAKAVTGSETILGLIPAGSGNGLAHHLNISLDLNRSLELINHIKVKKIDTVNINDEFFVSIAGIGFDALVARKFANAGQRGFLSYFRIITAEYPDYRPRHYSLEIDGKMVEREALFVSFANTDQFGYNTVIAPQASIDDGLIDVCIVKKVPYYYAPQVFGLLLRKKIDHSEYVEIIKAREIRLTRNNNRIVNVDGEPMELEKELFIRVNPRSLNIIAP